MDFSAELSKIEAGSKEYKFFEKVFEKLDPNCVRKSLREKQNEVHRKFCDVQEEYFQKCILRNAIMQSAEACKSQTADPEALSFVHSTYLTKSNLPSEDSQKPELFGLSKDKVLKMLQNQKSQSKYAAFKKSIEDNINDFCQKLLSCTGAVVLPGEDWQNAFERTIKEFESKVVVVSSKRTEEQLRKKQLREMIATYYHELSKGVSLLIKSLALIEENLAIESDFSELYHLRCHAVSLKLKCSELKILKLTYDRETMPVLKKISTDLQQSEQRLKDDSYEKTAALESYLQLGEEYEHLVDEYTDLIKSINQQKWAINELKTAQSQYGASGHD